MTNLLGWTIIMLALMSISMGVLYPGYRLVRRTYPESRRIPWLYPAVGLACSLALWYLLPILVHLFFWRDAAV